MGRPYTLAPRMLAREAKRARRTAVRAPAPAPANEGRPTCRAQCAAVPRPCPYVSCRYNLFLDVRTKGAIKLNRGDDVTALLDSHASCALDVAADGAQSLDRIADLLNMTRERVRQLEEVALARLQAIARETNLDPGQMNMGEELYVQAPADEALNQLNLGDDKEWLTRLCNRMDVHGETWKL